MIAVGLKKRNELSKRGNPGNHMAVIRDWGEREGVREVCIYIERERREREISYASGK